MNTDISAIPTRYWRRLDDGRVQCDVCPRRCALHEGQRGLCFVRGRNRNGIELYTYGRSSGFCVDPIEKKPLNHFLPGTPVLSFGTAGCNLACKFCQNWDMSKSREMDTLADSASPGELASAARDLGCASVAFTYNDPTVFMEYAIDVAQACREVGVKTVAVTAGYMCPEPRADFFRWIDAANVDLKAFTERFYRKVCGSELAPVLDTLLYLKRETSVWFEITTLLIPGENDSDAELDSMTRWIAGAPGRRRAAALLGVPPRLEDDRSSADAAADADPGAGDRDAQRAALRLHRQRARQGGRQHLVPGLRRAADRARLVSARPLGADAGRMLR